MSFNQFTKEIRMLENNLTTNKDGLPVLLHDQVEFFSRAIFFNEETSAHSDVLEQDGWSLDGVLRLRLQCGKCNIILDVLSITGICNTKI